MSLYEADLRLGELVSQNGLRYEPEPSNILSYYSARLYYTKTHEDFANVFSFTQYASYSGDTIRPDSIKFRIPLAEYKTGTLNLKNCVYRAMTFDVRKKKSKDYSEQFSLSDIFKEAEGSISLDIEDNEVVLNGNFEITNPITTVFCKVEPSESLETVPYSESVIGGKSTIQGNMTNYAYAQLSMQEVGDVGFENLSIERLAPLDSDPSVKIEFTELTKVFDGRVNITLPRPAYIPGTEKLVYSKDSMQCNCTFVYNTEGKNETQTVVEADYEVRLFSTYIYIANFTTNSKYAEDGYKSFSIQCPLDVEFGYDGYSDIGEFQYQVYNHDTDTYGGFTRIILLAKETNSAAAAMFASTVIFVISALLTYFF